MLLGAPISGTFGADAQDTQQTALTQPTIFSWIEPRISVLNKSIDDFEQVQSNIKSILATIIYLRLVKIDRSAHIQTLKMSTYNEEIYGKNYPSPLLELIDTTNSTDQFNLEDLCGNDIKLTMESQEIVEVTKILCIDFNSIKRTAAALNQSAATYTKEQFSAVVKLLKILFEKNYTQSKIDFRNKIFLALEWLIKYKLENGYNKGIVLCTVIDILFERDERSNPKDINSHIAESISTDFEEIEHIKATLHLLKFFRNKYIHGGRVDPKDLHTSETKKSLAIVDSNFPDKANLDRVKELFILVIGKVESTLVRFVFRRINMLGKIPQT